MTDEKKTQSMALADAGNDSLSNIKQSATEALSCLSEAGKASQASADLSSAGTTQTPSNQ